MGAIEESFSELASAIQKQRTDDDALDEICQDYELLIADMHKLTMKKGGGDRQLQSDMRNSLKDLRREILTTMQRT